jgi:hypothetical protein
MLKVVINNVNDVLIIILGIDTVKTKYLIFFCASAHIQALE